MGELVARVRDLSIAASEVASGHGDGFPLVASVKVGGSLVAVMRDRGSYLLCTKGSGVPWVVIEGHRSVLAAGIPLASHKGQTASAIGFGQLHVLDGHDVLVGGPSVTLLDAARINGRRFVRGAIEAVYRWTEADRARFIRWFGDGSNEARARVLQNLVRMDEKLSRVDTALGEDENGAAAYVLRDGNTVYVTEDFWGKPSGVSPRDPSHRHDSQAGTFVHESSHFGETAHTDDNAYGADDCEALAAKDPAAAQGNADNYKYFAEDTQYESVGSTP